METNMIQYELINYTDVWGNKKDGYEVNNLCSEGFIEVPYEYNHKDLIQAIKEHGFFKKHVRQNMLDIWDEYEMIDFSRSSTGEPICRLELRKGNDNVRDM